MYFDGLIGGVVLVAMAEVGANALSRNMAMISEAYVRFFEFASCKFLPRPSRRGSDNF